MNDIMDKVAIIGMGCSKFGFNWADSSDDMIIEAAYEAFDDAGVDPQNIQAAWVGTLISGMMGIRLARPLKLEGIPIIRVENGCGTAIAALRDAALSIVSKTYDLVLVVGFEKFKDLGYNVVSNLDDVMYSHGRSAPGEYALAATRYFHTYGIDKETLAKIAVKNHRNGCLHPKAHFRREITLEQALSAPIIAWPLGLFDCCPRTDGAAAAIICPHELADNYKSDYILIKGIEIATGAGMGRMSKSYDYCHWEESFTAANRIYEQIGIKEPAKEISLAEVHDCFTINELFAYEDLGFCPRGQAKAYIDEGFFERDGQLPVNVDGGLKSFGHPQGATGIRMIYELYNQFRGKAEKRQIQDMRLGLAQTVGGTPGFGGVSHIAIVGGG